jgi:hypothetical protein
MSQQQLASKEAPTLVERLANIDRRIIYLFVALSLSLPIIFGLSLPPAKMETASNFFAEVSKLKSEDKKMVLIASDWGPGTQAENKPQTLLAMEHLMRKRIPFALISITPYAAPFLENLPRQMAAALEKEFPDEKWSYGADWVNFGYRPGGYIMIQGLAKATDFYEVLKTDAGGTPLEDIPMMAGIRTIKDISMLMEFTGLVSAFNYWIQFFQSEEYTPPFVHGCTSITIPEAYIYFVSGQITGLHEGAAGAAWYEKLLSDEYPNRVQGVALRINTSLAIAHLIVIAFLILGNIGFLLSKRKGS